MKKKKDTTLEIIKILNKTIGALRFHNKSKVYLHEPDIRKEDWKFVKECLKRNFVSSVGNYVNEFEDKLKKYTKAKYVIATVNATSAIHLSLVVMGANENDEVILPSLNFVAAANAVRYCNSIPHFVEVEEETLGIDPIKLEKYLNKIVIKKNNNSFNKHTNKRIKFMMPLHVFGHPAKILKLKKIAKKFNLKIIEDAAESLGSTYKKKHLGTFGDIGVLSFNGNKIITTGGGGALLTNSLKIAKKLKYLSTTAKTPHRWKFEYSDIGFNYRMPGINASLGCAQMKRIKSYVNSKRKLFKKYKVGFDNLKDIKVFQEPKNARSNYWLQTIILDNKISYLKDKILEKTNNLGFSVRPVWKPLHKLNKFKSYPRMEMKVTNNLEKRILNLPSSVYLSKETKNYEK
jgi:perosamine synthetase